MFTPEIITELKPNEVFVYGANEKFLHGAGAAKLALQWGAKHGKSGLQGQTYGIPTKDKNIQTLSLNDISIHIKEFIECVVDNPKKVFLLTKIGMGLAGYHLKDIAPLFKAELPLPENLVLPKEFHDIIYGN